MKLCPGESENLFRSLDIPLILRSTDDSVLRGGLRFYESKRVILETNKMSVDVLLNSREIQWSYVTVSNVGAERILIIRHQTEIKWWMC